METQLVKNSRLYTNSERIPWMRWFTRRKGRILMQGPVQASSSERGQSLVELAFGLVVLILLLAGAVDLGRAFFTYMQLRDAAQEGAVFGSICPKEKNESAINAARIEARVRDSSDRPVALSDTLHVQVACKYYDGTVDKDCSTVAQPVPGNVIRVRVSYDNFEFIMPLIGTFVNLGPDNAIDLHAEVSDTILRKECP